MVSRSVRAVSGCTAAFCLGFVVFAGQAQTTPSTPASPGAQQTTSGQSGAPAQTPQAAPPLQFHDLPAEPHTPTPAEQAQEQQQRILIAAARLATMEAQWGPESSTPGLSIELKEVDRTKEPDGSTQLTYQIKGKGFPPDEPFQLLRWPLNVRVQTVMSGVRVNSQGTAICGMSEVPPAATPRSSGAAGSAAGGQNAANAAPSAPAPSTDGTPLPVSCAATTKPGQPILIRTEVAKGEAVRVALVGTTEKDGKPERNGAAVSLVPFPLENRDKSCTLQVIRGMKDAALVLVEGTGFPPETAMKVDTVTGADTRVINTKTNTEGRFVIAVVPGLRGQTEGDTTVHFGGIVHTPSLEDSKTPPPADPGCDPSLTFHWGGNSYQLQ